MLTQTHELDSYLIYAEITNLLTNEIQGEITPIEVKDGLASIVLKLKYLYSDLENIWRKA